MESTGSIYHKFIYDIFRITMLINFGYLAAILSCLIYAVINRGAGEIKDIAAVLGTAIAIFTLWKGIYEYQEHVKRQRIQYLLDMGRKYSADENITNVVRCLERLSTKEEKDKKTTIRNTELDIHDIEMFMRFIEELQVLIDTHVVNKSATLYLFGFYVKTFDEHHIWLEKLDDYNEAHWGAFMKFVKNAKKFDFNYKM